MNKLKNIIKEEIENTMIELKLKNKIPYLQDFEFDNFFNLNGVKKWCFSVDRNNNQIYVKIINDGDTWSIEVEPNGKHSETHALVKWGPFNSFEEMCSEVVRRLDNNMQLGYLNVRNHKNDVENEYILKGIKELSKKGKELFATKDESLSDLKSLYKRVMGLIDLPDAEIMSILRAENQTLNGIVNSLNKMSQINYYKKLEKFKR